MLPEMARVYYRDVNVDNEKTEELFSNYENNYIDMKDYEKRKKIGDVWFDFGPLNISIKVNSHYIYDCDLKRKLDCGETWVESWFNHLSLKSWFNLDIAKKFKLVYEGNKQVIADMLIADKMYADKIYCDECAKAREKKKLKLVMLTDSNKMRIDHIKLILQGVSSLPEDQKEIVYQLARHIIQLCSNEYEKDIKEICNILKI